MDPDVEIGLPPRSGDGIEVLLSEFAVWLDERRGLSSVTVVNYVKQVRKFLRLLVGASGGGTVDAVVTGLDGVQVTRFMVGYCQDRNVWSAKAMVTALRAFFRFAHASGRTSVLLTGAVPAVASWRGAVLPKSLSAEMVERLLFDGTDSATVTGRRDRAILMLMARLGLRSAEVTALELSDIDWRAGVLTIRGKGDRLERLPLPEQPGAAIAAWLIEGRPTGGQERAVFTTVRGPARALGPESVRAVMARACVRAGLPRVGTHRFRHTLATDMLRAGASLPQVGQVLRHRSLLSTTIYAKVDQNALRPLARPWPGSVS